MNEKNIKPKEETEYSYSEIITDNEDIAQIANCLLIMKKYLNGKLSENELKKSLTDIKIPLERHNKILNILNN